jgi:hypothetical protein
MQMTGSQVCDSRLCIWIESSTIRLLLKQYFRSQRQMEHSNGGRVSVRLDTTCGPMPPGRPSALVSMPVPGQLIRTSYTSDTRAWI